VYDLINAGLPDVPGETSIEIDSNGNGDMLAVFLNDI